MSGAGKTEIGKPVTVVLPLFDNDGRAFSSARIVAFEADLRKATSGWTSYDGMGTWWNEHGQCFRDRCRSYQFVTAKSLDCLREDLRWWARLLGQEAMFLQVGLATRCEFISGCLDDQPASEGRADHREGQESVIDMGDAVA